MKNFWLVAIIYDLPGFVGFYGILGSNPEFQIRSDLSFILFHKGPHHSPSFMKQAIRNEPLRVEVQKKLNSLHALKD